MLVTSITSQHLGHDNVQSLESRVAALEAQLDESKSALARLKSESHASQNGDTLTRARWPLTQAEYTRYGRQLVLPELGLKGHKLIRTASVLIVGAGGLGCPAAQYLAGAGLGRLGIIDGDTVSISNLHRQTLFSTMQVGSSKVNSAIESLRATNPDPAYIAYPYYLNTNNAVEIFSSYDLILDCTDRPSSRYLISDVAVFIGRPVVSASALGLEGQLMVLNNPPTAPGDSNGGPCYRCIFPKPPPPEAVLTCGEGGILGPVVGLIGVLQALEALKVILARSPGQSIPSESSRSAGPQLLLFSALTTPQFRSIRLRPRKIDCFACSKRSELTEASLSPGCRNYDEFCGIAAPIDVLAADEHISAERLSNTLKKAALKPHILVDTREKFQFELCSIDGSVNIPFSELNFWTRDINAYEIYPTLRDAASINVICQRGNDSQLAVKKFKELGLDNNGQRAIKNVSGGLEVWRRDVDPSWPSY